MASVQKHDTAEDRSDEGSHLPDCGDAIDPLTFEQILEMDDEDEDDRGFSRSIVYGFFEQAEQTFKNMESALEKKDLGSLQNLGHFLKGSSATLGLIKVKDSCEKIQNYGGGKDESGNREEPNDEVSLQAIKQTLARLKVDYADVEKRLKRFYEPQT